MQHNATQEHSGRNNPRSATRLRCPKRSGSYVTWRTCGLDYGVGTGWSVRPTGAVFLNSNMKEDSPPSSTTAQEHPGAVRNHMEPATTVAAPKQTRRSHMTAWHNERTVVATAVPQEDAAMVPHASSSENRCRVPTQLRSRVPKSPIRTSRTREPAAAAARRRLPADAPWDVPWDVPGYMRRQTPPLVQVKPEVALVRVELGVVVGVAAGFAPGRRGRKRRQWTT